MYLKPLVLIAAFIALGMCPSFAGDSIHVDLYFAQNSPPPANAHLASDKMTERLTAVFGFKYYEVVKSHEVEMDNEWQQWAIPRTDLFIRVEPLHHEPGQPKLVYFEIYNGGFIAAHGNYEPHSGTPLFINGPDFKNGRFILVLEPR
jgi:hypothetical protein